MSVVADEFSQTHAAIQIAKKNPEAYKFYFESPTLVPQPDLRFSAFQLIRSPKNARVIILGQDPYPRKESANGLSFCDARSRLLYDKFQSVSMRNILKAIILDADSVTCSGMDQVRRMVEEHFKYRKTEDFFKNLAGNCGVFFINASLTFENKETTKKHADFWRPVVLAAIRDCITQAPGVVLVLFGQFAQQFAKPLEFSDKSKVRIVQTEHPANFSFCQSGCFQKIQQAESELGIGVTDWQQCCVVK